MMIKADIINAITKRTRLSKQDIEGVLDLFCQTVRDTIRNGEEIEIRDFAIFRIKERQAYIGRNPKTGEKVQVPAKKVVKIIPSKRMVVKD
jgi:integration host factor subunit beta